MRQPIIILYRWILWLSFVALWAVPSYLGLIATGFLVYSMPGIVAIMASALYMAGHLFLFGLFAGVYWVCTGHTGIFTFFYVPLMMGAVIGQIDLFWKAAIPLLHGLMACLCGVLAVRLRKVRRKAENPTE